jgi:hypothetical protein
VLIEIVTGLCIARGFKIAFGPAPTEPQTIGRRLSMA